jgi:hypothetical protein
MFGPQPNEFAVHNQLGGVYSDLGMLKKRLSSITTTHSLFPLCRTPSPTRPLSCAHKAATTTQKPCSGTFLSIKRSVSTTTECVTTLHCSGPTKRPSKKSESGWNRTLTTHLQSPTWR